MEKQDGLPRGIYALADPTSAMIAFNLNNEFNLFGRKTYLIGTVSKDFPVIDDAPVEKAVAEKKIDWKWVGNLATGILVTAALAACAILVTASVIATGGAMLGPVLLIGATVGAAAVTTSVAVTDYKSGNARSWGAFLQDLVMATTKGAMAAAMIYGLWTSLPVVANYSSFAAQYYTGIVSPLTYNILPKVVTFGGYGLLGAQGIWQTNEIAVAGSGSNWLLEKFFGGNQDNYDSVAMIMDLAAMGLMEVARNNVGFADVKESKMDSIVDGEEKKDTNETSLKEINIHGSVNTELDEVDLKKGVIYEDKNASKLYMDNPDYPQTEMQWAEKQIFKKGKNRIEGLQQPDFRLSSQESSVLPSIEQLKDINDFVFRIDADTPELRLAVQSQMDRLTEMFPGYNFSATYGGEN